MYNACWIHVLYIHFFLFSKLDLKRGLMLSQKSFAICVSYNSSSQIKLVYFNGFKKLPLNDAV